MRLFASFPSRPSFPSFLPSAPLSSLPSLRSLPSLLSLRLLPALPSGLSLPRVSASLAAAAALTLPATAHAAVLPLPAPAPPPVHASAAFAAPAPEAVPGCASPDDREFPLTTRIHGGPAGYEPGGGYRTWYLDLTNTTRRTCEDIHPVVVLVDKERRLAAHQARLEFSTEEDAVPRPVRFETTDQDELVGVFGGEGVSVGPGRTVTLTVRLAVTADAVPNEVTANAAVVQRQDDDGDWVDQSNDYRFTIGPGAPDSAEPGAPDATGTGPDTGTGAGTDPGAGAGEDGVRDPGAVEASRPGRAPGHGAPELASTGPALDPSDLAGLVSASVLLIAAGAVLVPVSRRATRRR